MNDYLLQIQDLSTSFKVEGRHAQAVDGVSFSIKPGETLGVVGESGCGKSVTALSVMGLVPSPPGRVDSGKIIFNGEDLLQKSERAMRRLRGNQISMIFQEPMTSLNPVLRIGQQISESLVLHENISRSEARKRSIELLEMVGISSPDRRIDEFPHQLSGGMKQRVMIAMALALKPKLLIADEPTTALDVTIQAQILELLSELQKQHGMSIILITHDLAVVAEVADRVVVMYSGKVVEQAETHELFKRPLHPYTEGLFNSLPQLGGRKDRLQAIEGDVPNPFNFPEGCRFHLRCPYVIDACKQDLPPLVPIVDGHFSACLRIENEALPSAPQGVEVQKSKGSSSEAKEPSDLLLEVKNLKTYFPIRKGIFSRIADWVRAVDDVSFEVRRGETLGVVGESGCGKTTVGRSILRLVEPNEGEVIYDGKNISQMGTEELRELRQKIQIIFQDPFGSLNPRMPIESLIAEGLEIHNVGDGASRRDRVVEIARQVGLEPDIHLHRYPHEFSGGQRQRVGIARALALNPDFIVCDEAVSALDVSIQAQIINLLKDLQAEHQFTYLFIAHDLSVIRHISDRVLVMYLGKVVEMGTVAEIFENPRHPYTKALLSAVPIPDPERVKEREVLSGDVPSPINPPSGCRFHTRCPVAKDICSQQDPEPIEFEPGHRSWCLFE